MQSGKFTGKAAVFLDRDGVVIEDSGYLGRADQLQMIAGSAEAVARFNDAALPVVLVTNQSGIGRGYYGWEEFEQVQSALELRLAASGAWLDGVWACASHPDGSGEYRVVNDRCRKPNPGMLEDAMAEMGLAAEASWMVGDKISDIEAGLRAGTGGIIHVLTGYGSSVAAAVKELAGHHPLGFRVRQCADLAEAATLILGPGDLVTRGERI